MFINKFAIILIHLYSVNFVRKETGIWKGDEEEGEHTEHSFKHFSTLPYMGIDMVYVHVCACVRVFVSTPLVSQICGITTIFKGSNIFRKCFIFDFQNVGKL